MQTKQHKTTLTRRVITATALAAAVATSHGADAPAARQAPLMIEAQGSFAAGGTVIRGPGSDGPTLHGDHARVFFQVPVDARSLPLVMWHGFGQFGKHRAETPALIRYGQMTQDEFFVSADAAKNGIVVKNESATENMVFLKHFGPGNPQAPIGR